MRATLVAALTLALLAPSAGSTATALSPTPAAATVVSPDEDDLKWQEPINVLVVRAQLGNTKSDGTTKARLARAVKGAEAYVKASTGGKVGFNTTYTPVLKLKGVKYSCSWSGPDMDHLKAARAVDLAAHEAGYDGNYQRVVVHLSGKTCPKADALPFDAHGLSSTIFVHGKPIAADIARAVTFTLTSAFSSTMTCKKKGKEVAFTRGVSLAKHCVYQPTFDKAASALQSGAHRKMMGWFTRGEHVSINKTRTLSIKPVASTKKGKKFVEIPVSKTRSYWVEYRTATGLEKKLPKAERGVQVRLHDTALPVSDDTFLLDLAPRKAALTLARGKTWTSPEGVKVKVLKVNSKGAKIKITPAK